MDPELWCVHLIGPDTVIAAESREEAAEGAGSVSPGDGGGGILMAIGNTYCSPLPVWQCWDPEVAEEADAKEISAHYADHAAELFAERRHSEDDYPERRTVHVRDAEGNLSAFEVRTEPSVEFRSAPVEVKK